jgi:hypothetical protein
MKTTIGWIALLIAFGGAYAAIGGERLGPLRIMSGDYPQAFFFRNSEGLAANPKISYEEWDKTFSRLMGIEGKVLDEEVPGRSQRNIDFFTRFKKAHPDQLVLLHYNGNARDPVDAGDKFFAGHWEYQEGAKILADVSAQTGETELHVSNARLFRTNTGRFKNSKDDIGLFALKADGQVDWSAAEQVQLISADAKSGTIRVRRACFGTKPRAFAAGKAYAAAHRAEGPWGKDSHLLWFYNFALNCPRDAQGRTCTDVLVDELGGRFQKGAPLEAFDGLEFDVLRHGDARSDSSYGAGVMEFCRRLHEKMGADRLLMADGWSKNNQRAFGILNGIESEGWPALKDIEVQDWAGGMNRQSFWVRNSAAPAFNYINHKFNVGGEIQKAAPMGITRLVFAGAMMTDSALCYSLAPEPEDGERYGIWDELKMGKANRLGWLGKPAGPAVHLAMLTKNLVDARTMAVAVGLNVTVPANGPDLVVRIKAHAGKAPLLWNLGQSYSWLNDLSFPYEVYLDDVKGDRVTVEIKAEDPGAIRIESVEAYAHPDVCYRIFEHGLVLANPSPRPYTFDLSTLVPGKRFQRLQGSARQDAKTNDGSAVGAKVTVGPHDGLFLHTSGS